MPTKLSESFSLEELIFSQTAARDGIDNRPNQAQVDALRALCLNVLQPLRDATGQPVTITSGFRSPRLNKALGGAEKSQHMEGKAADVVCFNMTAKALFKRTIELQLPFDQLIYEGGKQSIWVHVSFNEQGRRGQIMRASFPAAGGVLYTKLTRAQAMAL